MDTQMDTQTDTQAAHPLRKTRGMGSRLPANRLIHPIRLTIHRPTRDSRIHRNRIRSRIRNRIRASQLPDNPIPGRLMPDNPTRRSSILVSPMLANSSTLRRPVKAMRHRPMGSIILGKGSRCKATATLNLALQGR